MPHDVNTRTRDYRVSIASAVTLLLIVYEAVQTLTDIPKCLPEFLTQTIFRKLKLSEQLSYRNAFAERGLFSHVCHSSYNLRGD